MLKTDNVFVNLVLIKFPSKTALPFRVNDPVMGYVVITVHAAMILIMMALLLGLNVFVQTDLLVFFVEIHLFV
jgi:hypothetical protein